MAGLWAQKKLASTKTQHHIILAAHQASRTVVPNADDWAYFWFPSLSAQPVAQDPTPDGL